MHLVILPLMRENVLREYEDGDVLWRCGEGGMEVW